MPLAVTAQGKWASRQATGWSPAQSQDCASSAAAASGAFMVDKADAPVPSSAAGHPGRNHIPQDKASDLLNRPVLDTHRQYIGGQATTGTGPVAGFGGRAPIVSIFGMLRAASRLGAARRFPRFAASRQAANFVGMVLVRIGLGLLERSNRKNSFEMLASAIAAVQASNVDAACDCAPVGGGQLWNGRF